MDLAVRPVGVKREGQEHWAAVFQACFAKAGPVDRQVLSDIDRRAAYQARVTASIDE